MKILQLSAHYYPNIGGIETHLSDLTQGLVNRDNQVTVLTYQPLTSKRDWKVFEKSALLNIIRLPWLPGLFYKFVKYPPLEFLYLLPGLLIFTPAVLIVKNPSVIHAHGLVAGFVGVFWGKLFKKKVIVSTHSIYHFPKKGLYRNFVSWIFKQADIISGLSELAVSEILSLGINPSKVKLFTYWIDLKRFNIEKNKNKIRKRMSWDNQFIVLFVGRLVEEKGLEQLLEAAKIWNSKIRLVIIGSGPLEGVIVKEARENNKLTFVGPVEQEQLPTYYNGADVLIVPSSSEEGFGRVIIEALACGVPVVGANRGAIPEAMDKTVGRLIDVSPLNIKNEVEYLFGNPSVLKQLSKSARQFVERRYSEKNIEIIINSYRG